MSDRPNVLKHPYGTYLMVRPEFVLLRDDDLQARIMRIIEGWMEYQKMAWQAAYYAAVNAKQPPPPEPAEYWVTISQSQFIAQLYMFDAERVNRDEEGKKKRKDEWDIHNAVSKGTLRKALHALENDKIIRVRPQMGHEFESAQYTLNIPYVQELEDNLPKNYLAIFGGVTNFECPPVTNFESGGSNNCNSPVTNSVTPQLQKNDPLIDRVIDTEQTNLDNESNVPIANAIAPPTAAQKDEHTDASCSQPLAIRKTDVDITQEDEEDGRDNTGDSGSDNLDRGQQSSDGTHRTVLASVLDDAHGVLGAMGNRGITGVATHMADTPSPVVPSLQDKPAELQKTNTPVETEKPKRNPRKPKMAKVAVNAEEEARITAVFDAFDALAREMYGNPEFRYDRSKAAREAIIAFLENKPTIEKLRTHYSDLFKRPMSRDGFLWRDNMSIAAVCRDYGRKPQLVVIAPPSDQPVIPEETPLARKYRLQKEQYAGVGAGGH